MLVERRGEFENPEVSIQGYGCIRKSGQRFDVGAVDRIDEDLIGPPRKKDFIILVGSEAQISNDSVAVRQTIVGFQSISAHGGGEPISRQIGVRDEILGKLYRLHPG